MSVFYEIGNIPVHSVLLYQTFEEAVGCKKGNISLGYCSLCGFISNLAFDPTLLEYSSKYEETQSFSKTFNTFHHRLAKDLIERYNLRKKSIVEIGCGKGEFLTLLCKLGGNSGTGFDPSYIENRHPEHSELTIDFVKDFFTEKYAPLDCDLICCKMTLEHISKTFEFLDLIRRSLGTRLDTIVFFQVPDAKRILSEAAFWDIYYEHCSYFTGLSLTSLFKESGFEILKLWRGYDDQYLMIEAKPAVNHPPEKAKYERPFELERYVNNFSNNLPNLQAAWKSFLYKAQKSNKRTIVWGSGSKAVSFLTTLQVSNEIQYVVDINPHRQETFIAGSGQRIVSPGFLTEYQPATVILMNPIYHQEVLAALSGMNLFPKVFSPSNEILHSKHP